MVSTAGHLFNCVSITYIEKESYWHNVSLVWEHKKQNKNINIILLFNKGSNQKGFYTCWPSSPHIADISQVLTVLTACHSTHYSVSIHLPLHLFICFFSLHPHSSFSCHLFSPFTFFFILLLPSLPLIHHILILPFFFSHFHNSPLWCCFYSLAHTQTHTHTHTHTRTRTHAHTHPHTHRKTCKNIKPERVVHTLSSPL